MGSKPALEGAPLAGGGAWLRPRSSCSGWRTIT